MIAVVELKLSLGCDSGWVHEFVWDLLIPVGLSSRVKRQGVGTIGLGICCSAARSDNDGRRRRRRRMESRVLHEHLVMQQRQESILIQSKCSAGMRSIYYNRRPDQEPC